MNTRMQRSNPRLSQRGAAFCLASLLLVINVSCVPASAQPPVQPTPSAVEPAPAQPTPSATEPAPTPTTASPTATGEALLPAGWTSYTSQGCEYALSYPAAMQISSGGAYSRSLDFKLDNPDEGARNFIYVSVIIPEFQSPGGESIYNYDPREAGLLLNLQVGESKSLRDDPQIAPSFTYQRQADTTISGHAAQTYENVEPWEFPSGTKEIRYYLSLNGCMYQIGGYVDTTQSNQPGAITEDLFHQIVATLRVMP
jgi:hypothetical protein